MPTYEYRCHNGHEFDIFQRMSDEPVGECPECGEHAERLVSGGAGFLFKGSGFYITDSRSEDYKKKASADSPPSSKDDSSSSSEGAAASSGASSSSSGSSSASSGDSSSSSNSSSSKSSASGTKGED